MSDWQDKFAEHTTAWAFHLSLSADQASLLAAIGSEKDGYKSWISASRRNTFIPTFRGLERRGLAEHNPAAKVVGVENSRVKLRWIYRLTPAGVHVLDLLRLAGVAPVQSPTRETEAAE